MVALLARREAALGGPTRLLLLWQPGRLLLLGLPTWPVTHLATSIPSMWMPITIRQSYQQVIIRILLFRLIIPYFGMTVLLWFLTFDILG